MSEQSVFKRLALEPYCLGAAAGSIIDTALAGATGAHLEAALMFVATPLWVIASALIGGRINA